MRLLWELTGSGHGESLINEGLLAPAPNFAFNSFNCIQSWTLSLTFWSLTLEPLAVTCALNSDQENAVAADFCAALDCVIQSQGNWQQ